MGLDPSPAMPCPDQRSCPLASANEPCLAPFRLLTSPSPVPPTIQASRVARVALWLLGEYCTEGTDVAAAYQVLKVMMPLPLPRPASPRLGWWHPMGGVHLSWLECPLCPRSQWFDPSPLRTAWASCPSTRPPPTRPPPAPSRRRPRPRPRAGRWCLRTARTRSRARTTAARAAAARRASRGRPSCGGCCWAETTSSRRSAATCHTPHASAAPHAYTPLPLPRGRRRQTRRRRAAPPQPKARASVLLLLTPSPPPLPPLTHRC